MIAGYGGHMDASLIHQIAWEYKIARIAINNLLADGNEQAAYQRGQQRDHRIAILKARLRDRGYYRAEKAS